MCPGAGTSHVLPRPAPSYAGSKRTLAVYDPVAAEQRADAARLSSDAGALVPSPVAGEPIKAVPLAASAPKVRTEPPWIRAPKGLLPYLSLRIDLPVYFVDEKTVTATDVDSHQNRFRLPSDGVMHNLHPLLSPLDREAANLLDGAPVTRLPKLPEVPGAGEKEVRKRRRGRAHGGLPVLVIDRYAGIRELQLTRWESSGVCVIKGEGYMDFINNCGFSVGDVVEIWAFKQNNFRLFKVDIYQESPLYVLFIKKAQMCHCYHHPALLFPTKERKQHKMTHPSSVVLLAT